MAIPIPRISWGDGFTITEGVNDRLPLSFYHGTGGFASYGYCPQIPAGSYATPEALLAAVTAAIDSEIPTPITGSMPDGRLSLVFGEVRRTTGTVWTTATAVSYPNVLATSDGRLYLISGSGTTGTTEPTSEVNPVTDGTAELLFLGRNKGVTLWLDAPPAWTPSDQRRTGMIASTAAGRMYVCTATGTTGATEPTGETSSVADGSVTWRYVGRVEAARALGTLLGYGAANVYADASPPGAGVGTASVVGTSLFATAWSPDVPVRADVEREFESVVTQVETAGGQNKTTRWTPESLDGRRTYRRVRLAYLKPERVFTDAAGSSTVALETFWRGGSIGRFTYSPDRDNPTVGAQDYFLRESSAREFKPRRMFDGVELYEIELEMGLFTP